MTAGYNEDFYLWSQETARALVEGRISEVDLEHVAEEIRDLGISQKRELEGRLMQIMTHLLQQGQRSWTRTIATQRDELESLFRYNPSLRQQVAEVLPTAYRRARRKASQETGIPLDRFPEQCPFTVDDVLGAL